MDTDTLESLRVGIRDGNEASFRALVRALGPELLRFSRSIVHETALAEDVVQQGFVRIYRHRRRIREAGLRAFCFKVVRNLSRNAIRDRRLRREREAAMSLETPQASDSGRSNDAIELWELAQKLPEELWSVIRLHYAHGLTVREVAEVLGIPRGTASSRLGKGLSVLRERYMATAPVASTAALSSILEADGLTLRAAPLSNSFGKLEATIMATVFKKKTMTAALLAACLVSLALGTVGVVAFGVIFPFGESRALNAPPLSAVQDTAEWDERRPDEDAGEPDRVFDDHTNRAPGGFDRHGEDDPPNGVGSTGANADKGNGSAGPPTNRLDGGGRDSGSESKDRTPDNERSFTLATRTDAISVAEMQQNIRSSVTMYALDSLSWELSGVVRDEHGSLCPDQRVELEIRPFDSGSRTDHRDERKGRWHTTKARALVQEYSALETVIRRSTTTNAEGEFRLGVTFGDDGLRDIEFPRGAELTAYIACLLPDETLGWATARTVIEGLKAVTNDIELGVWAGLNDLEVQVVNENGSAVPDAGIDYASFGAREGIQELPLAHLLSVPARTDEQGHATLRYPRIRAPKRLAGASLFGTEVIRVRAEGYSTRRYVPPSEAPEDRFVCTLATGTRSCTLTIFDSAGAPIANTWFNMVASYDDPDYTKLVWKEFVSRYPEAPATLDELGAEPQTKEKRRLAELYDSLAGTIEDQLRENRKSFGSFVLAQNRFRTNSRGEITIDDVPLDSIVVLLLWTSLGHQEHPLQCHAMFQPDSYEAEASVKEGRFMFTEYGFIQFVDPAGAPMNWKVVAAGRPEEFEHNDYYDWAPMHGDSVLAGPTISRPVFVDVEIPNVPGVHRIEIPQAEDRCVRITVSVEDLGRTIEFQLVYAGSGAKFGARYRLAIEGAGAASGRFVIETDDTGRATAHGMPPGDSLTVTVFRGAVENPESPTAVTVTVVDDRADVPIRP